MGRCSKFITLAIILTMICSFFSMGYAEGTEKSIYVNPVDGISGDFIMGADVSMLKQIEISGGKYYDNGVEKDALVILKEHGVNWVRFRIWNDPTTDEEGYAGEDRVILNGQPAPEGTPAGAGNCDRERTIEMVRRAKDLGFKVLLDFHYSDFWADPGKQAKPKSWENLTGSELETAVYDYTSEVLREIMRANPGYMPDMVQIGNEIPNGMMLPDGRAGTTGLVNLINAGIQAVRDNDPENSNPERRTKIMLHLDRGGNNALYRGFFDYITSPGEGIDPVTDFDVIGLSYYSYWHGPIENLKANMNDISERYGKEVAVAEVAYAYTLENADDTTNNFGIHNVDDGGYVPSVQGQATAIRDVIAAVTEVPGGNGIGIFYWEPDWIAVEGAGWITGQGTGWENQALFDFEGNALPSLDVFNLVRGSQDTVIPDLVSISSLNIDTGEFQAPVLPETVKGTYNDGSIRDIGVVWEDIEENQYAEPGNFSILGTVSGTRVKAIANIDVTEILNFVQNPGFEEADSNWAIIDPNEASSINTNSGDSHGGNNSLHYWSDSPFEFTAAQTITGLENGYYKLSAYADGEADGHDLQLFVEEYGGERLEKNFNVNGWGGNGNWIHAVIDNIIHISNGCCTVGYRVSGISGSWGNLDDVALTPVDEDGNPLLENIYTVLTPSSEYVGTGNEFAIDLGLTGVSETIYGEEITMQYNNDFFEFVGAEAIDPGTTIVDSHKSGDGIQVLQVQHGSGLDTSKDILRINFRANMIDYLAYGKIAVSEAKIKTSPGSSYSLTAALSERILGVDGTASILLSAPGYTYRGRSFNVSVTMDNIVQNVYAHDITISYDAECFELETVTGNEISDVLDTVIDNSGGFARILGYEREGVSGESVLASLKFKVKPDAPFSYAHITVEEAELGTAPDGIMIEHADLSSINVQVRAKNSDNDNNSWDGGGQTSAPAASPAQTPSPVPVKGRISIIKPEVDSITGEAIVNINNSMFVEALNTADTGRNGIKTVEIQVAAAEGVSSVITELPNTVLNTETITHKVKITTDFGIIEAPSNMLHLKDALNTENISVRIGRVNTSELDDSLRAEIGNRLVIELELRKNGEIVSWDNPDAPVTVSVPYTPAMEEMMNPDHIIIWYIDGRGNAFPVPNAKYYPETGTVIFKTTHFSKYAIGFVTKTFDDLSDAAWAQKPISALASKGVIHGTSKTSFSPNAYVTRADYVVMLVRALGLSAAVDENFDDIYPTDYYYDYTGIANKLGIVNDSGTNLFYPGSYITREDLMIMTAVALEKAGKLNTATSHDILNQFSDSDEISSYARPWAAALVKEGIVGGNNNLIAPKDNATRAEAAVIIYGALKK